MKEVFDIIMQLAVVAVVIYAFHWFVRWAFSIFDFHLDEEIEFYEDQQMKQGIIVGLKDSEVVIRTEDDRELILHRNEVHKKHDQ